MSQTALDSSSRAPRSARPQFAHPQLEQLESREMLSASGWHAHFNTTARSLYTYTGSRYIYTPSDIRYMYGFNQINYGGQGQTIVVVDAYDAPNIYQDLMAFDKAFNLPGQSWSDIGNYFIKANQNGTTNSFPQADSGWALEASLDVEWAHAMAPYARIVLLEANSSSLSDLLSTVSLARYVNGASVVTMSWGGSEFASEASYDGYFTTIKGHTPITFVASSGDDGAWYGTSWPAVSPNVLAVGGTSLYPNFYEAGWSASGGGFSAYEQPVQRPLSRRPHHARCRLQC
jgi:subtilase family serine protease